ncbi:unnamed protein product [Coccothraustes coccothraustes]
MAAAGTTSAEKSPGGAGQRCHTAGGGTRWNRRLIGVKLSFRAQRCAKGGGTAHAPPPPGTPHVAPRNRRSPGQRSSDSGAQIAGQRSSDSGAHWDIRSQSPEPHSAPRQCSSVTGTAELSVYPHTGTAAKASVFPFLLYFHEFPQPHTRTPYGTLGH